MSTHQPISRATALAAGALGFAAVASAQPYTMISYTIGPGGTTVPSTGGAYAVSGSIGQPAPGSASGGPYSCGGGFWGTGSGGPPPCYANCDGSTIPPTLNVSDFICFQQKYAAADPYANCDGSTIPPTLNVSDFICFQQRYAAGCP